MIIIAIILVALLCAFQFGGKNTLAGIGVILLLVFAWLLWFSINWDAASRKRAGLSLAIPSQYQSTTQANRADNQTPLFGSQHHTEYTAQCDGCS